MANFRIPLSSIRVHGRVTIEEPKKAPVDSEADALKVLVSLFDFAITARKIDDGIDNGTHKGMPRPRRCKAPVGGGNSCNLPLRTDETGQCAFHKAVHRFGALELGQGDIFEGTPKEAEIRTRAATLKP